MIWRDIWCVFWICTISLILTIFPSSSCKIITLIHDVMKRNCSFSLIIKLFSNAWSAENNSFTFLKRIWKKMSYYEVWTTATLMLSTLYFETQEFMLFCAQLKIYLTYQHSIMINESLLFAIVLRLSTSAIQGCST